MNIFYKINNGDIGEIPKYWDIQLIGNLINIYIYNYLFITVILFNKNTYIGYLDRDKYIIYYCKNNY